jgi:hypothetical protein
MSKSGWSSLNVVIFPPVMRLVLDIIKHRYNFRVLRGVAANTSKGGEGWREEREREKI